MIRFRESLNLSEPLISQKVPFLTAPVMFITAVFLVVLLSMLYVDRKVW